MSVTVHNYGDAGATSELLAFEGDPAQYGAAQLGAFPVAVAGGNTATVTFPWTRRGAQSNLYFQLTDTVPADLSSADDATSRNAYLEAIYSSGRVDYGVAPYTSGPAIGDILGTGNPVIAYGEAPGEAPLSTPNGYLTLIQKSAANTLTTLWTRQVDNGVGTPVFANVDGDGGPKIIFLSVTGFPSQTNASRGNTIHVWLPDSGLVWAKSYAYDADGGKVDACMNEVNLSAPGVGDVNGDGFADVVFPTADGTLHVLDGRNGNVIWEKNLPTGQGCANGLYSQPSILDINGDGLNEVLLNISTSTEAPSLYYSNLVVYSSTGTLLTPATGLFFDGGSNTSLGGYMVAATQGPGKPPSLFGLSYPNPELQAVTDAGVQVWGAPLPVAYATSYNGPFAAADAQGLGLPMFFAGALGSGLTFKSDGSPGWQAGGQPLPLDITSTGEAVVAGDLLGLGQPQFFVTSGHDTLGVFRGSDGQPLLQAGITAADWGGADEAGERHDLAIADVDNDGHGEVVVMNSGDVSDSNGIGYNNTSSVLVFGSDNHWQAMPNVWSGIAFHHQFNSNLTLTSDAYKPWTTHNTWREQFVTKGSTLMADLLVTVTDGGENDLTWAPSPSDGGSVPAGNSTNVTVTVHNIGGLAASSVPVSLYAGNPADGGTLIATKTITGTLDAGGGVGSTVFSWTAWPLGWDQLTAVANAPFSDGGRAIGESNYGNNQYSTIAFVRPGTGLADIAVAGANFGGTLGYAAGQPVTLETTVSNNGAADAGAFTVVFIDGAGGVGPVIGTKQITGLKAGGATVVQIANWLPAQGVHVVTVEADPYQLIPDSNLGNNTAVITFTIGNATKPDLQITSTDLALTPAGPVEPGTTLELGCLLHNEGTSASNVGVKVTLDSSTTLLSATIAGPLTTGEALPFTIPVATSSLATGLHTLTVTADPTNTISEYNESNNSASISFTVGSGPGSVIASTDKSSYGANAAVVVTAALAGLTTSLTAPLTLNVDIDTATGDLVSILANGWGLSLGSGVTENLPFNWNTGDTPPGSYVAFASLIDPTTGTTVSTSKAAFTVAATVIDTVTVAPLLNGYQPGITAVVATQIDDQSLNASIANATLVLQINTPAAVSFYTSTREFLNVGAGNDLKVLDSVAIPFAAAAGNYPMTATLKTPGGTTLATGTGTLVVQAPTVQNQFAASLTATPPAVAPGTNVTLVASLTNQSGGVLNNQAVSVQVVVPSTQAIVAQWPVNENFAIGQNIQINNVWNTAGVAAGTYLAGVLINGAAVAHAVIHVDAANTVPPLITVTGVTDGKLTNQSVTPVIAVNYPSGAGGYVATLDGAAFTSGTAVNPAGTHVLLVTATDVKNNVTTLSVTFTIYNTAPRITVGGVSNNQYTNAASVAPTVTIVDPYLDPTKTVMLLNGTTFYQGMQITSEGSYVLAVTAQDKAGNSASMNVSFVIDRTVPVITITGVTNGEVTNAASVAATISVTDLHLNTSATSIKLNGAAYTSGTAITAENTYALQVSGADLAGNTASQSLTFYIDRTAPVITITGVVDGGVYAGAVQPTITITEAHPNTSSITLDAAAYTSGTAITASGGHALAVSATDKAGNSASATDNFKISPPSAPPFFNPGVCAGTVALTNAAWIAPQLDAGLPILLNSSGNFTAANTSMVIGSCIAAGNLTFSDTSDLVGTALLGGTETLNGQAVVGAIVQEAAGYTSPCCPFNFTTALTAAATNNDNARLPTSITSHVVDGGFLIYDGGVSFPSGDFYFLSFEVGDGGSVGLASGAVTQIYVNGPLSVQGTFGGDSTRIKSLTVMASGTISLSAGQSGTNQGGVTIIGEYPVPGLFYSGGTVNLSGSTEVIGGVVGTTVNVSGNASVVVPLSLTPPDAGMVCQ